MTTETLSWMADAGCKGKTEFFFFAPEEPTAVRKKREFMAKAICKQCPVLLRCREYARSNNELGVWGGETEEERFSSGYLNNSAVNRLYKRHRKALKLGSPVVKINVEDDSSH